MTPDHVRQLYAYNRWANRRVLDSVAALGEGELTRDLASSFPSVRDTLVHMLSAEWIWLMRWKGASPAGMLDPREYPSPDALLARWGEVEREQAAFVDGLDSEALARRVRYTNTRGEQWEYPLGEMLVHVVNHASYHRGQVATMLRQLGRTPAPTDLLLFRDELASG